MQAPRDLGGRVAPEFADLVEGSSLVVVPIVAAGRWIGIILVDPGSDEPLDDARRDLLWLLGKTLALAIRARAEHHQRARARQLEERIELARELHDSVVQRLFGVSLALGSGKPLDAEMRERCAEEINAGLGELRTALQRPLGRPVAADGHDPGPRARAAPALPSRPAPARSRARSPAVPPGSSRSRNRCSPRRCATPASTPTAPAWSSACGAGTQTLVLEVENDARAGHVHADAPASACGWPRSRRSTSAGIVEFGRQPPATLARAARRPAGARGVSAPFRVLVVDDHDVVHWGFRLMLGELPWVERCLSARAPPRRRSRSPAATSRTSRWSTCSSGRSRAGHLRAAAPRAAGAAGAAHQRCGAHLARRRPGPAARTASSRRTGRPRTSPGRCGWSASG